MKDEKKYKFHFIFVCFCLSFYHIMIIMIIIIAPVRHPIFFSFHTYVRMIDKLSIQTWKWSFFSKLYRYTYVRYIHETNINYLIYANHCNKKFVCVCVSSSLTLIYLFECFFFLFRTNAIYLLYAFFLPEKGFLINMWQ